MFDNSVVKKTGQIWKLIVLFSMLMVGSISLFCGIYLMKDLPQATAMTLVLGGIIVSFASLGLGVLTLRCPHCKSRWLWHAFSTQDHRDWLFWLMSKATCPKCNK